MNAIDRFAVVLFSVLFLASGVAIALTDNPVFIFLTVLSLAAVTLFGALRYADS